MASATVNGIEMSVLNDTVNAIRKDPQLGEAQFRVSNRWLGGNHNCSTIEDYYGARKENHHKQTIQIHADEPPLLAGHDAGANPVEHLLNALAACMTTSLVAHAAQRGITIEECTSEVEGDIDLRGFLGLADVPRGFTNIRVTFYIKTDEAHMQRLRDFAEYSPVFNTILDGAEINVDIFQRTANS
jgi:uncharacterized OsmC-like protein